MPKLLTEYNAHLIANSQPPVVVNAGDVVEWLRWSYNATTCGSGSGNHQLQVDGNPCQTYPALAPINMSPYNPDPNVNFGCPGNLDGKYAFFLRITSAAGCQKMQLVCFDYCAAPTCNSVVSISVSGCNLTASVTNCPSPSWQWYYNGSLIPGATSATYTANNDGTYLVTATGCPSCGTLSAQVDVTCAPPPTCNCSPTATLNNCILSSTSCPGYVGTWYKSANGITGWVPVSTSGTYTPTENAYYKRVYTKAGCPTVETNTIQVTCVSSCNIMVSLTSNGSCQGVATWSGAGGMVASIQWSYAITSVPGDCSSSSGWVTIPSTDYTFVNNPNGTGSSTLTPQNGAKCYRLIIDNTNNGCPTPTVNYIYLDPANCCVDNPTLSTQTNGVLYNIQLENRYVGFTAKKNTTISTTANSSSVKMQTQKVVRMDGTPIVNTLIDLHTADAWGGKAHLIPKAANDYMNKIWVKDYNTDTEHEIQLYPLTSAHLTGVAGAVNSTDLLIDNTTNFTNWCAEMTKQIKNAMDNLFSLTFNTHYEFTVRAHNNAQPSFYRIGIYWRYKKQSAWWSFSDLKLYNLISQRNRENNEFYHLTFPPVSFSENYTTPCGQQITAIISPKFTTEAHTHGGGNIYFADMEITANSNPSTVLGDEFQNETTANVLQTANDTTGSATCNMVTITVINYPGGSTFLWSSGETTDNITKATGSGSYSVTITAPNGCQYIRNITI